MAKSMNWALDPRQPRRAQRTAALAKATAASQKPEQETTE